MKSGDRVYDKTTGKSGTVIDLLSHNRAMVQLDGQRYPTVKEVENFVVIVGLIEKLLPIVERIAKRVINWFKKK